MSKPLFVTVVVPTYRERENIPLVVGRLDGRGYPGAGFAEVLYVLNADIVPHTLPLPGEAAKPWQLHPALTAGTDPRWRETRFDPAAGTLTVPARTVAVFVVPEPAVARAGAE